MRTLGNVEEVKCQSSHSESNHLVESLEEFRFNENLVRWEIEVKWLGLEGADNTWEPAMVMVEDVPKLVERMVTKWVKITLRKEECKRLCHDLGLDPAISGGGSVASGCNKRDH